MDSKKSIVLKTLLYSDIFEYPLKISEIEKFAVGKVSQNIIKHVVQTTPQIENENGYYFLKGKKKTIYQRLKKEKISVKKINKIRWIVWLLAQISTIQYIGLSGSLAMLNANDDDDIDLFFIVKGGSLWMTRIIVLGFLAAVGKLRRRNDIHTHDKICANMWIDTNHLAFNNDRKNIYTAHEIVQMQTLFNRNKTYEIFLWENKWVQNFLPNVYIQRTRWLESKSLKILSIFEKISQWLQMKYMQHHRTSEAIREGFLAFHPDDYTKLIISHWRNSCKNYGI